MKEKIGSLCILLGVLATMLPAQTWSGDQAVALQVQDSKGRAIANARVVFTFQGVSGETGPDIVATDGNGRAVLASLAPGPWQIEISHPEYLSYIAMVDVRRGKKPLVSASFLEAGGRSLSPVKVKFSKGDRQPASPVLEARQSAVPPVAVPPVVAEREAPAPQIAEVPDATPTPPAPAAPEPTPEVIEPVSTPAPEPEIVQAVAPPEATTPEPVQTIPEPVSETAAEPEVEAAPQQASKAETVAPDQTPAPAASEPTPEVIEPVSTPAPEPEIVQAVAPPEPEQPAAPLPTEVEIAAAQQVAVVEPDIEDARVPDPEPTIVEPEAEDEALIEEVTPPVEEIVPEQIPEKAEAVTVDVAAVEPEAEVPVPPTATTEAPPQPPVAVAPTPAAVAVPPPPDPGAQITSHSNGSCQDCASAEWTLQASVAAPAIDPGSAGTCGTEILEVARAAMQGLSTSIQLELDGFIGPIANGTSQEAIRRVEPDLAAPFITELADYVGGTSPCQIVGLVLPKAVRFSRVQLAAGDRDGTGSCAPGQACAIGDAVWLGSALVERGPSATVIYGLFENRSVELGRRALLTAYYRPPNANWRPRLPPAD